MEGKVILPNLIKKIERCKFSNTVANDELKEIFSEHVFLST